MFRSIKIFILLLVCSITYGQDTTHIGHVWNFVAGLQIDSIEIKQITFYNDDSLRIISGNDDTIMVGGTSSGGGAETDPVYNSEPASSITAQDLTDIQNLSGTNTGDQDLSSYATKSDVSDSLTSGGVKGDSAFVMKNTEQVFDSIAFSSTINVDFTSGSDYKMVVVTGDITINITDLYGGESMLDIIQDGAGGHTVTKGTGWGDLRKTGTISTDAAALSTVQFRKIVGPGGYEKTVHWID